MGKTILLAVVFFVGLLAVGGCGKSPKEGEKVPVPKVPAMPSPGQRNHR